MRTPRLKALRASDFPSTDPKLLEQLNTVLADMAQPDTPLTTLRTVTLQVGNPASKSFPLSIKHGLSDVPEGAHIVGAVDLTDGSAFTTPPYLDWIPAGDGESITARNILGLTAGHVYRIAIRFERT